MLEYEASSLDAVRVSVVNLSYSVFVFAHLEMEGKAATYIQTTFVARAIIKTRDDGVEI